MCEIAPGLDILLVAVAPKAPIPLLSLLVSIYPILLGLAQLWRAAATMYSASAWGRNGGRAVFQ
jgi:hypothetical protein